MDQKDLSIPSPRPHGGFRPVSSVGGLSPATVEARVEPGSPLQTDEALVSLILAGDVHLYENLLGRYEKAIVNFIYRMTGDYQQSLDLAQEVFFKVYRSLGRFDPAFKFSTWLYRIASNRAIDHLRRKSPRLIPIDEHAGTDRTSETVVQLRSPGRGPDELLAAQELGEQIQTAVDELPLPYRELILLRHMQGLPYETIASVKGLPLGTVKNRLFRAREMLKKRLEPK